MQTGDSEQQERKCEITGRSRKVNSSRPKHAQFIMIYKCNTKLHIMHRHTVFRHVDAVIEIKKM